MTRVYDVCGVRVRSEIELPLPAATGPGWDVDVTWGPDADTKARPPGEVIAELDRAPDDWWYVATATPKGYLIRFRDRGDFLVSAGVDRVEVRPADDNARGLLPVLLAGTMMALLLTLRGHTVLHASAVEVDGAVLAVVGPSGCGKSTLATVLCLSGATLVTDDILVVQPGAPVRCVGGATELRLRKAATPLADARPDAARRMTADDRLALSLDAAPVRTLPLAAIVAPAPARTITEVELELLTPSTALMYLMSAPRIYGWRRPDVLSRDFTVQSAIVNQVPMFHAWIPWGPPFDPTLAESFRKLVADGVPAGEPRP